MGILGTKQKKLTDILLDDTLSKVAYDEKYDDFTRKIEKAKGEKQLLLCNLDTQKNLGKRMKQLRETFRD